MSDSASISEDHQAAYEQVLFIVEHTTGEEQVGVRPGYVVRTSSYSPLEAKHRVSDAVANGDLYRWEDPDGRPQLSMATRTALVRVIEWEIDRDGETRTSLIADINHHIDTVEGSR